MKFFKNNFVVKFILTLFIVGFIFGIIYYMTFKPNLESYMLTFINNIPSTHQNTFLLSIASLTGVFILSISVVGLPIILIYIFLESFSIGFTLIGFIYIYKIPGLIFYILFILLVKLMYLILLLYLTIMSIRFIYKLIIYLKNKDKEQLYKLIINHFYRYILIIIVSLINSTLIYFFANKLLLLLSSIV